MLFGVDECAVDAIEECLKCCRVGEVAVVASTLAGKLALSGERMEARMAGGSGRATSCLRIWLPTWPVPPTTRTRIMSSECKKQSLDRVVMLVWYGEVVRCMMAMEM